MNLEQAQQLRSKLLYLEGLIAWNTREYIWKVIIGPEDICHRERFRGMVDPCKPINSRLITQSFRPEELSVFFFLKTKGFITCREYLEFLSANDLDPGGRSISSASLALRSDEVGGGWAGRADRMKEKMPALMHHFQIP